jgi:hypothetical protein
MHIVSFDKEVLNITIHNLYPDLVLTSPVYYSTGTVRHIFPSQKTDIGTITKVNFGIDFKQEVFRGTLLYKLQRKHVTRIDNQFNSSTASTEDKSTNIYLLVVFDLGDVQHNFYAYQIELNKSFTSYMDMTRDLYDKYKDQVYKDYKSSINTWLIYGDAVIKMRCDVTYGLNCKLDIIISEGTGKYNMKRPMTIKLGLV